MIQRWKKTSIAYSPKGPNMRLDFFFLCKEKRKFQRNCSDRSLTPLVSVQFVVWTGYMVMVYLGEGQASDDDDK